MALLELENIHSYYGHIHALKGISLEVPEGEIVTLIGANGAGKSTTLRTISGLIHAREGSIQLHGRNITRMAPHEIVAAGVEQPRDGAQRGGLPRAVCADQGNDFTFFNAQGNALEGVNVPVIGVDVFQFQQRHADLL